MTGQENGHTLSTLGSRCRREEQGHQSHLQCMAKLLRMQMGHAYDVNLELSYCNAVVVLNMVHNCICACRPAGCAEFLS